MEQNYTDAVFSDVAFLNETHGWVVGQWVEGSSGNGIILHTADAGQTWQTQLKNGTEQRYYKIGIINCCSVWVAGYSSLFHSSDGGLSWEEHPVVDIKSLMSTVKFIDDNIGWTATNTTLYRTTDAGWTWTVVPGWTFDDNPLMFEFLSETEVWSIGFRGIYKSTDGAETWTQAYEYGGWSLSMQDDGEGWAVGDGRLMHTSNRVDWRELPIPGRTPFRGFTLPYFTDILFIDDKGWIVAGEIPIMHTPDGGSTWFAQSVPSHVNRRLKALDFLNETYGWAVGYDGVILRTTRGTDLGTRLWNGLADPLFITIVGAIVTITVIVSGYAIYHRRKRRKTQANTIE